MGRGLGGKAERYSVTLYPLDREIAMVAQERMQLNTFSAAVQQVLRRWAEQNGVEVRGRLEVAEA